MRGFAFLIKFSYRNLWRAPKRTMIMLMSLALGSGFIIWDLNFANSGSREVMKEFLSQYAGQYQVTHNDYYEGKNTKKIDNYKTITDAQITDKKIIADSTQRVTAPIFVSGEKKTLGVLLTGLDVNKELKLSTVHKAVTVGRFLDPAGSKEIILGKRMAERINAKINDEVVVIGQALDGSVANDLMKVVGLLDFGGGDLEESLAFTQIDSARELMAMVPDQYHQRVNFNMQTETVPSIPGVRVTYWMDILPEIGVSVKFIDNFTWIVSIVIVLVISLGLSNTLMITFFEREKEFQSLNIIGAKTSWVTKSLMLEVFMMGTVSLILGCMIGHIMTTYNYYNPIDIQLFTGGKPIIMGGMSIQPLVRIYPVMQYYWQVPLMIYFFLALTMIYPLIRVIRRSKHAI
ncbi:MAG TPA: FtsX-like permease family protein [Bacteriovoracaceae bacterium]|nr:FtsX-like permease family protein [Bacteriovoracaceae bacterium]